MAYDNYWPRYTKTWKAIGWTLTACTIATIEFTVLYLVATDLASLSPFSASIGAYLITFLGGIAGLVRYHRIR